MKPVYALTPQASKDLREIARYTKETWGAEQAGKYRRELRKVLETLAQTPRIGRSRKEFDPGLRSFQVGSYIVFYKESKSGINVARILHSRRDAGRQLRG